MGVRVVPNQDVKVSGGAGDVPYAQLASLLLEAIPRDIQEQSTGKVLAYLARETLAHASPGNEPPRVPTKAIHIDLGGNPNQEPSAWLSRIWKDIEGRRFPEIEPTLIELCRKAGLSVYPVVLKEEGSPTFYRLDSRPLPVADEQSAEDFSEVTPGAIRYTRDLSLQLSWPGRLLLGRAAQWTPMRRLGFLAWQLLGLSLVAVMATLIWLVLWSRKDPLAASDLVLLIFGFGIPWFAYRHLDAAFRIFDDRIIVAPEWMLAWKERGATIEINRSREPGAHSTILVQRYSAQCPICGWMVRLENGGSDFPRRIVGRCEENPREHVFSFDRSTKWGKPLRTEACGRQ